MSQGSGSSERYVPSGVNAESWLGFEQRIQERRFRALLDTMNQAIEARDIAGARVAVAEARELRPDAPELAEMEMRIDAIAIPIPEIARTAVGSRAVSAVLLLLIGIALLMGIDWMRSSGSEATPLPSLPPTVQGAAPIVAAPKPEPAPVTIVPPPSVEELVAPEPTPTTGEETGFRAASTAPPPPPPAIRTETPDDFVFRAAQPVANSEAAPARPVTSTVASLPTAAVPTAAAPVAAAPVAPAVVDVPKREPGEESRVAAVLNEYARAYGALDAGAAREVWPSVNERALARAFAGLASQDVEFDDCAIDVRGATANASCRGKASYVGKIGSSAPRSEARVWRFELRRDGDAWKIETAEARRQ